MSELLTLVDRWQITPVQILCVVIAAYALMVWGMWIGIHQVADLCESLRTWLEKRRLDRIEAAYSHTWHQWKKLVPRREFGANGQTDMIQASATRADQIASPIAVNGEVMGGVVVTFENHRRAKA